MGAGGYTLHVIVLRQANLPRYTTVPVSNLIIHNVHGSEHSHAIPISKFRPSSQSEQELLVRRFRHGGAGPTYFSAFLPEGPRHGIPS